MPDTCLILLTHGSKNPNWRKPFEKLLRLLRKDTGADSIHLSFMESAEPALAQTVELLTQGGCRDIQILPLFMSSGNHLSKDIPAEVRRLTRLHKGLKITTLPPIGSHPRFIQMMLELARHHVKKVPSRRTRKTPASASER